MLSFIRISECTDMQYSMAWISCSTPFNIAITPGYSDYNWLNQLLLMAQCMIGWDHGKITMEMLSWTLGLLKQQICCTPKNQTHYSRQVLCQICTIDRLRGTLGSSSFSSWWTVILTMPSMHGTPISESLWTSDCNWCISNTVFHWRGRCYLQNVIIQ